MIGIAVGDPINRVNLLYLIDGDRIHRRATRKLAQMPGPPQSHTPWTGKIHAPEGRCEKKLSPGPLTSGRALFISTRNLALALGEC